MSVFERDDGRGIHRNINSTWIGMRAKAISVFLLGSKILAAALILELPSVMIDHWIVFIQLQPHFVSFKWLQNWLFLRKFTWFFYHHTPTNHLLITGFELLPSFIEWIFAILSFKYDNTEAGWVTTERIDAGDLYCKFLFCVFLKELHNIDQSTNSSNLQSGLLSTRIVFQMLQQISTAFGYLTRLNIPGLVRL